MLRLGDLASQCIGRIALALPSGGGRTRTGLAFHGSSPGSDEGGGEGGVGTRCVKVGSGRQRRRGGEESGTRACARYAWHGVGLRHG